jgi:transposase
MWKPADPLSLSVDQRLTLSNWIRGRATPQKLALRARIILMAAEGQANYAIAGTLRINRQTVLLWRGRFARGGLGALQDASRPGRKPALSPEFMERVVRITTQEKPAAATHWSTRSLARHLHVSKMAIQRIWKAHGLQPHRVKTFKLSRDPHFVEKLRDVVGLYLNPPEHALVLSVDEKSQIQALDRTQPGLPMKKGRCGTLTHDYKRNGTTTLFAAFNVLEGTVLKRCQARHRHQEFLAFLKQIEGETPAELDLHLIVDNYGTHKHPRVRAWLARHPRFHFHFLPTSSSWLNLVERWFRELTQKRLRRGIFRCVPELEAAIAEYVEVHNAEPQPFIWTATAESILAKVQRATRAYNIVQKR